MKMVMKYELLSLWYYGIFGVIHFIFVYNKSIRICIYRTRLQCILVVTKISKKKSLYIKNNKNLKHKEISFMILLDLHLFLVVFSKGIKKKVPKIKKYLLKTASSLTCCPK